MDASAGKPGFAWQPLTPRGVAAFAGASLGRLLAVEFLFALLAAATVIWFLRTAWFPVITQAIGQLPSAGEIRAGRLDWHGESPVSLAENRFLAFTVDLKHEGKARSPAHIQVEFGEADYQVFSLLGFVRGEYRREWAAPFNREDLVPWWGAWRPALLGIAAGAVLAILMLVWGVLATIYALPVWLLGLFANRELSLGGSWRVAGAALMPGALVMVVGIFLYGCGALGLIELAVAMALHYVIGWIYLIVSPLRLPPHPAVSGVKENPFRAPANGKAQPEPAGTDAERPPKAPEKGAC
jgi:hypothetical protein